MNQDPALRDIPFASPETAQAGLALEMEMLTQAVQTGQSLAFLWQAQKPGLVLPERFSRSEHFPQAARNSAGRGWPVTTRKTGGGITPQGPGVLNLALAFTTPPGQSRTIQASYGVICDPLAEALNTMGVTAMATAVSGSFCDGDYNLAVDGRKIVGTAQRWRGNTCLCHALLLTDIDLAPAVSAVAAFSAELGHDAEFNPDVHCRLADLVTEPDQVRAQIHRALWAAIAARDFTPYQTRHQT